MSAYLLLFVASLLSVSISYIVIRLLSKPLIDLLSRICPDAQAAGFWASYTKLMLFIAPLVLVLMVDMFTHFADPLNTLRLAFIAALSGILLGLHIIGKRLGRFLIIPQQPTSGT